MVSKQIISVSADGKHLAEYRGTSSDTKPLDCANGSVFIEMDTATMYFFDGENHTWRAW